MNMLETASAYVQQQNLHKIIETSIKPAMTFELSGCQQGCLGV